MRWVVAVITAVLAAGCASPVRSGLAPEPEHPSSSPASTSTPAERLPLAGHTIVIDPGHQLGNGAHASEINRPVDAGGFAKACNTTGTATNAGYPEATFTWEIARLLRRELRRRGATARMTRSTNSSEDWGPCIDERGRAARHGDLLLSLHADGSLAADARGFHVISRPDDPRSAQLARDVRAGLLAVGLESSTYTGDDGLVTRSDLGTLNLSPRPAIMVELGNMRDDGDARLMSSPEGRRKYAAGLLRGVRRYLR
ncbi:N-acetylmuramoyl-L-alanine amidase family protein [Nocardioides daejeonensis]|uniref:N-acetylmuramoyl-L-alanine amidase family protein n=1 Tax=Nocardioides daejeonensis TaxID=1046556 RepID=UPI000D742188|nr:N-acetylmuramoyl-L-alanine amidase [Nocardioides daejeonensis]